MHWESSGVLSGIFEELALQPAGSRAQDAIKRLDCRCAVKLPDGLKDPVFGLEALDLRFGELGHEQVRVLGAFFNWSDCHLQAPHAHPAQSMSPIHK
jgi:hypothetical protein